MGAFRCVFRKNIYLSKASCPPFRRRVFGRFRTLLTLARMFDAPAFFGRDMSTFHEFGRIWLGHNVQESIKVRYFVLLWPKIPFGLIEYTENHTVTQRHHISS